MTRPPAQQRRSRILAIVTVVAAALAARGFPAAQQAPTSQPSASIRGTLQDTAGSAPAGVFVVVFPADPAAWPDAAGTNAAQRVRVEASRYAVTGLPAGDYRLTVAAETELADWPSAALFRRLAGRQPMPVLLSAGEAVTIDARIAVTGPTVAITDARMARTTTELRRGGTTVASGRGGVPAIPNRPTYPGAISGRVIDADGRPVEGAVMLSLRRGTSGALLPFHERGVTDADGRYRLGNRSPGDYFVVAVPLALELGAEVVTVRRGPPPIVGDDGVRRDHVATFHGGATAPESAPAVTVAADERSGIDIRLVRLPVFDLIGAIVDGAEPADRRGPGGFQRPTSPITLTPVGAEPFGGALSRRVPLAADKTFVVKDLPGGEYRIVWSSDFGFIDEHVVVGGRGVTTARLSARPGVDSNGRVEFRGATPPPGPLTDLARFGVEVRPAAATAGSAFVRVPLRADGTFSVRAVGAGPFRVSAVAPAPWVQIEGLVNGFDSLDMPAAASSGFKDVVVVFADKPASLSIEVADAEDRPVANAGVLLFIDDTRYWGGRSRRVQIGQPGATGVWTAANLPPARYLIVASRQIVVGTSINAAYVGGYRQRAQAVELGLGETKTIRVRVD